MSILIDHRHYRVAVRDLVNALKLEFSTRQTKASWLADQKKDCKSIINNRVAGTSGDYLTDKKAREICRSEKKFDLEEELRVYRLKYIPPIYHEKTDDWDSLKKKYV